MSLKERLRKKREAKAKQAAAGPAAERAVAKPAFGKPDTEAPMGAGDVKAGSSDSQAMTVQERIPPVAAQDEGEEADNKPTPTPASGFPVAAPEVSASQDEGAAEDGDGAESDSSDSVQRALKDIMDTSALKEEAEGDASSEEIESLSGSALEPVDDSGVFEEVSSGELVEESPISGGEPGSMDLDAFLESAGAQPAGPPPLPPHPKQAEGSKEEATDKVKPLKVEKQSTAVTWHWVTTQEPGDKTGLRAGYKITYLTQGGGAEKEFVLYGKTTPEGKPVEERFMLALGQSKKFENLLSKDGLLTITLVNTAKGVRAKVEGGKDMTGRFKEGLSKVGGFFAKLKPYTVEIVTGVTVTASAAIGMANGWLSADLGNWHIPVLSALTVVTDAACVMIGLDRRKDLKKELNAESGKVN
jgi:hypothetical protein